MKSNLTKLLAIICFCLLIIALLVAYTHPASGYELNIYSSTPLVVWVSVIFCFFCGGFIIVSQIITRGYENSRIWILGLLILIAARVVLLYTPYIRGYISWMGDDIGYIGMVHDILINGHFTSINFYPVTHIFLSGIIYITGLPEIAVSNLSTAFISVLFILFIYLLTGAVTNDKSKQLLSVLIAGCVLIAEGYNAILAPNGWSILFMPLLFYLYFKYASPSYRILFLIILVMYPFFHPISSLLVIIALLILELTKWSFSRSVRRSSAQLSSPPPNYFLAFTVIEFMIFTTWIIGHSEFNTNISLFWQQITSGFGSGKVAELTSSLNKINVHGIDFYILVFKMFGADLILIVLSIIGILWLLKQKYNSYYNRIRKVRVFLPLAGVFGVFGFLFVAYMLGLPGIGTLGQGQWDRRFLGYVDILLPVFSAVALSTLLFRRSSRTLALLTFGCLIGLSSIISIFSVYASPYISQPNNQITLKDMIGTKWFIDEKDMSLGNIFIMSPPVSFAEGIIGFTSADERSDLFGSQAADHFGYNGRNKLGAEYPRDAYLTLTAYDRTIYNTVWKEVGRFNNADFEKLGNDSTVSEIYSNQGMDFYYVRSSAGS